MSTHLRTQWRTAVDGRVAAQGTDRRPGVVGYQEQRYENEYWEVDRGDVTRSVTQLDLPVRLLRDPAMVDLVRGHGTGGGWRQSREPGLKSSFETTKASIAEVGLLQPITVGVEPSGLITLIDGTHRLLAVEELGWETIPSDLRYFGGAERYWLYDHASPGPPDSYLAWPETHGEPVEVPIEPEVMW